MLRAPTPPPTPSHPPTHPPTHPPGGQEGVGGGEERSLGARGPGAPGPARVPCVGEEEGQAEAHNPEAEEGGGGHEAEEVAVVAPADAGAHPGAVVVEARDAVVADRTVGAARRAVVHAGGAELGGHAEAVDLVLARGGTGPALLVTGGIGAGVVPRVARRGAHHEDGGDGDEQGADRHQGPAVAPGQGGDH